MPRQKKRKKKHAEMAAYFAAHDATQAMLNSHSRQQKSVVSVQAQETKRQRVLTASTSWKDSTAMASTSFAVPQNKSMKESSEQAKAGNTRTESQLEMRATPATLTSSHAQIEIAKIEKGLTDLREFNDELERRGKELDQMIEQRLANLRSSSVQTKNRRKELAPPLRKD